MCSQSALFEVNAIWGLESHLPGDLHSPLQAEYSTLSGVIKMCMLRVRVEFYHSHFFSARSVLLLHCLDMCVYTHT